VVFHHFSEGVSFVNTFDNRKASPDSAARVHWRNPKNPTEYFGSLRLPAFSHEHLVCKSWNRW
jgi:hypothetical protein